MIYIPQSIYGWVADLLSEWFAATRKDPSIHSWSEEMDGPSPYGKVALTATRVNGIWAVTFRVSFPEDEVEVQVTARSKSLLSASAQLDGKLEFAV